MDSIDGGTLQRLRGILGPQGVRTGDALAALDPGIEKRNLDAGVAVLPAKTSEVAQVLALCNERGIAVVPQGGRTGIAGGGISAAGELILLTTRLNRQIEIDAVAGTATVEAGVTLSVLAAAAAKHGLAAAIDLGARDSCTVGGLISTNAGGMDAFRHGPMRRRVLGIEAVLADGRVLSDLSAVVKNNEGYDVKQIFIGAEGTLGVVTRAVLKLEPDPGERALAYCFAADAGVALALLNRLRSLGGAILTRAEIMWREQADFTAKALGLEHLRVPEGAGVTIIFEAASHQPGLARERLEAALGAALEEVPGLLDVLMPKSEAEARDVWRVREDWAVGRAYPNGLNFDVSVPLAAVDGYMRRLRAQIEALDPTLRLWCLGHLADGNLHLTVTADRPIAERMDAVAPLIYRGLRELGGSISAEHGIGLTKRAALEEYGDPVKLSVMRAVKRALDPKGLMNPGKVVV